MRKLIAAERLATVRIVLVGLTYLALNAREGKGWLCVANRIKTIWLANRTVDMPKCMHANYVVMLRFEALKTGIACHDMNISHGFAMLCCAMAWHLYRLVVIFHRITCLHCVWLLQATAAAVAAGGDGGGGGCSGGCWSCVFVFVMPTSSCLWNRNATELKHIVAVNERMSTSHCMCAIHYPPK